MQSNWVVSFCLFWSNGEEGGKKGLSGSENFLLGHRYVRPTDYRPLAYTRTRRISLDDDAFVPAHTGADGCYCSLVHRHCAVLCYWTVPVGHVSKTAPASANKDAPVYASPSSIELCLWLYLFFVKKKDNTRPNAKSTPSHR
nr:hypothetical protein [Pandoravirus aubagnensis]